LKQTDDNFKENFRHVANRIVIVTSSHWSFLFFFSVIIVWLAIGLWFGFSESWQLILHISLAIVTFLMVLLIQHVQHRETRSMQIKLDELLNGVEGARNAFINIQSKPDHHLDKLQNATEGIEAVDIESELPNAAIGEIVTSDDKTKKL
jgi:low affinity Fe/Cu permease